MVTVGDKPCTVISSDENEVICKTEVQEELDIGQYHPVSLTVNNRGTAMNTLSSDLARRFLLLPEVTNVSPESGSTEGGTLLTIQGSGYGRTTGNVAVMISSSPCTVQSINYTHLTCMTTPVLAAGTREVQVILVANGQALSAECEGPCSVTFNRSFTPVVTSYSPSSISAANSILTLAGSGFGSNMADLSIFVGNTTCTVEEAADTEVKCNVGSPIVGRHLLVVRHDNRGYAKHTTPSITVSPTVESVFPGSGSTSGGTQLRISGLGFLEGDTQVTVGDDTCTIQSVGPEEVLCTTPGGSAGVKQISVTSNSVMYPSQDFTYDTALTPVVTSVSPPSASSGDLVSISGSGFGRDTGAVSVSVDGAVCSINTVVDSSITCTLGAHSAGTFNILVNIYPNGFASGSVQFTYEIVLDGISPASGK